MKTKEEIREYKHAWYESHKEQDRERSIEYKRAYRESHKEQLIEYAKAYRASHKEHRAEYLRAWRKSHPEETRADAKIRRLLYPDKIKAVNSVNQKIRCGSLIRQPCVVCGNPKTDAHHEDYTKPLDVVWLCKLHHKQLHMSKERTQCQNKTIE